ncbi:hypothetical protein [Sinimarinibacterium thermocellulolyticum]|uniref:Uncharacterized protein n=1 Tax=Sinimarinibacterium thermocellulolyticum TaxID=3170016 RepID=A0ABV2ACN8_9GAMM
MRIGLVVLLGLLGLLAPPAQAEDGALRDCKIFDGRRWQGLGALTRAECLEGIEQGVGEYDAQGFKFGLWGATLLSADRTHFYRSDDGGKNWVALGLKAELSTRAAQAESATPEAADTAVAAANARADTSPSPAASEPLRPQAASIDALDPPASGPAAAATAPADVLDRRSCSLDQGSTWATVGILTLHECAQALDRSPDRYDELGYKYGYWNGVFLAANAREILSSTDSRSWQTLLPRSER